MTKKVRIGNINVYFGVELLKNKEEKGMRRLFHWELCKEETIQRNQEKMVAQLHKLYY